VKGWTVCRFHGARGGAPEGKANGAYKHGQFTGKALNSRRTLALLMRGCRKTLSLLG
jgi:hypothetical protein